MLAATPVVVGLISARLGHDRLGPLHWVGAALSLTGIYIVVGHGMRIGAGSLRGDLMMAVAVCCWAIYTLGSQAADDAPFAGGGRPGCRWRSGR